MFGAACLVIFYTIGNSSKLFFSDKWVIKNELHSVRALFLKEITKLCTVLKTLSGGIKSSYKLEIIFVIFLFCKKFVSMITHCSDEACKDSVLYGY